MAGFSDWWDAVASLEITHQEKSVLASLARHCDWESGARSFPSVSTMAHETGLAERSVQYILRSLECAAPCGRPRCKHRGRIEVVTPATRYTSTVYRLIITRPQQGRFDETAMRRRPDPYQHLYHGLPGHCAECDALHDMDDTSASVI